MPPSNGRRLALVGLLTASVGAIAYGTFDLLQSRGRRTKQQALQDERRRAIESIKPLKTEGMIERIGLPAFLTYWNGNVLDRLKKARFKPDRVQTEILRSNTIFVPPAKPEDIAAAERRVGLQFPASLRAFFLQTNGVKAIIGDDLATPDILSCQKLAWLSDVDPGLVDIWNKETLLVSNEDYFQYDERQDPVNMRAEYMKHALALSPVVESGVYLLNPQITFPDGEMEAWDFSVKYPGAKRYRSFNGLLEAHCTRACSSIDYWSISADWVRDS